MTYFFKIIKLIFTIVSLLIVKTVNAQFSECNSILNPGDTIYMPYYGNNSILDSVLLYTNPIIPNNNLRSSTNQLTNSFSFNLPIKFWIFSDDNGTNQSATVPLVNKLLEDINDFHYKTSTGIHFYQKCTPTFVDKTKHNIEVDHLEFLTMGMSYNQERCIDIYLVSSVKDFAGIGAFPWEPNNFTCIIGMDGNPDYLYTVIHELGHVLGLLHTHENIRGLGGFNGDAEDCYQEAVSRTRTQPFSCITSIGARKCEINGDALCDTDASLAIKDKDGSGEKILVKSFPDCSFDGPWEGQPSKDNWGDSWTPPNTNVMSYLTNPKCRQHFTPMQIAIMRSIALNIPWVNEGSISLSGVVQNGEDEYFIVPESIEAPSSGRTWIVATGGKESLIAGNSIKFVPGTSLNRGSEVRASIGTQTCLSILRKSSTTELLDYDTTQYAYLKLLLNNELERVRNSNQIKLSKNNLLVYPNPFENKLNFIFDSKIKGVITIQLYSITGDLVMTKRIENTESNGIEISTSDLNSNLIFYTVQTETDIFTGKLIKK